MSFVGQSPPRPDGLPKANGSALYGDDFFFPEMWFGASLRSPHPHARLRRLHWSADRAPHGATAVTAHDLPGPNATLLIDNDWPILADGVVRHVGEAVALVAAPTRLAARQALDAFEVDYEALPAILDLDEAGGHEALSELGLQRGDVERALAEAEVVVEGAYRTGYQEHIYIECQAMTAWFETDGTLVVLGSMQCPYYVHKSLVHAFGLPAEKVRVKASAVGGGFGGKEDYPSLIAVHAALLARACGRPVRLAYDRHEDIVGTTKRHPAAITHRTGVDRQGRLVAMDIDLVLDGGAYSTLSSVVLSRAVLHASGPYRCPNVRIRGRALRTHTAPNGAFRGFGAPQAQFATERQMDRVARVLGLDPLEIRLRNAVEAGDLLPTGQVLDETTSARLCLETAAARTDFRARWQALEKARQGRADGEPLRGIGLSLYFHGTGFTGNGERRMRSPVKVRLLPDGRIEVLTAMTDMGQGCAAVFPQMACDAAGLSTEDIHFADPDTYEVPDSGPTVASRTTMIVGGTIAAAVRELRDQVLAWWREKEAVEGELGVEEGRIRTSSGEYLFRQVAQGCYQALGTLELTRRHEPPSWQTFDESTYQGAAYPIYSWGADVIEVEIDPDTLDVRPRQALAVCEVGKAIHPTLCAGQIEGGTLQALGYALLEEVKTEEGRYLNDRLTTYMIPTFKDSPQIQVELLERPWDGGPFGAKGVGELPMDGGAPAAVAAVENATGIAVSQIPATPERLMEWQLAGQEVDSVAAQGRRPDES